MTVSFIPLGEICEFVYGSSLREDRRTHGRVKVFGSNGPVGTHNVPLTKGPTIVVGRKGSIGEVHWSHDPCFPIDTTYYIDHTNKPCNLKWLYYAIKHLDLTRLNKSAAVPGLNRDDAYEKPIAWSTISEQDRLAQLLDNASRLCRLRIHALEMSDGLLQAAFLQLFGDLAHSQKKGWEPCTLEELCAEIVDCPHSTPRYASRKTSYPCIRSSDLQNGRLDFSTTKYVELAEYTTRTASLVPTEDDVIYCREGARFGAAARVKAGQTPCLGQRVMIFRSKAGVSVSAFLLAFLLSNQCMQQARRAVIGTASPHVNVADIIQFRAAIPPLKLQLEFSEIAATIERQIALQRESLRQAEHLFDSLLRRAFGEAA